MDGVSAVASVGSILSGAFEVIKVLNTIKQGGKERLRLLAAIGSLWAVLQSVQTNLYADDGQPSIDIPDCLESLRKKDGDFDQAGSLVNELKATLKPSEGTQKLLQGLSRPFKRPQVDILTSELTRLTTQINLAISASTWVVAQKTHKSSSDTNATTTDAEFKAMQEWISPYNFLKQQVSKDGDDALTLF